MLKDQSGNRVNPVADPGFPKCGAPPLNFGQKPIIWQKFAGNLHENERKWIEKRVHIPGTPLHLSMKLV